MGHWGTCLSSTSNNFIFSSLWSKSDSPLSKVYVVCEISWCRCQQLTALSISTALVTKLLVIEQLLHPALKFAVSAPWHNLQLCPSSQQILVTPLYVIMPTRSLWTRYLTNRRGNFITFTTWVQLGTKMIWLDFNWGQKVKGQGHSETNDFGPFVHVWYTWSKSAQFCWLDRLVPTVVELSRSPLPSSGTACLTSDVILADSLSILRRQLKHYLFHLMLFRSCCSSMLLWHSLMVLGGGSSYLGR